MKNKQATQAIRKVICTQSHGTVGTFRYREKIRQKNNPVGHTIFGWPNTDVVPEEIGSNSSEEEIHG